METAKRSHSHQVIKSANFAYKKNYPFLGLHRLLIKEATFLYIVSIGKTFWLINTSKSLSTD